MIVVVFFLKWHFFLQASLQTATSQGRVTHSEASDDSDTYIKLNKSTAIYKINDNWCLVTN